MALTERLSVIIDARSGGAVTEFKKVSRATAGMNAETIKSMGLFDKLGQKAGVSGQALKSAFVTGGAAAAGAVAAFVGSSITKFVDLADKVRDFQRATGTSAEEASRFVEVLDDLGISAEVGTAAMFKLSKVDDSKLKAVGVTIAKTANGTRDTTGTLENLADAYVNAGSQTEKAQIAFAAFGKQGQALIPILEQGREGIERWKAAVGQNQILSDEDIQNAREFQIAIDALSDSYAGLQIQVGGGVVPTLSKLAFGIEAADEKVSKLAGVSSLLGEGLRTGLGAATLGLSEQLIHLGEKGHEAATKQAELDLSSKESAKAMQDAAKAAAENAQQLRELRGAILEPIVASRALTDAHRALNDAQVAVGDRRRELNDLLRKGAVDTKAVATAAKDLSSAERSVASAQRAVAEAEENLQKVRSGADPESLDDAQRAAEHATLSRVRAEERLAKVREQGSKFLDDELPATPLELAEAELDLRDALDAEADSQAELEKLRQFGTEGSKELRDAQEQLTEAHLNLQDAQDSQREALDRLRKAQAGDPEFLDKVKDAKLKLADAERNVGDAAFNELQARLGLRDALENEANKAHDAAGGIDDLRGQLWAMREEIAGSGGSIEWLDALIQRLDILRTGHGVTVKASGNFGPGSAGFRSEYSGKRAAGGPVLGGSSYLVGEKGPEILHMGSQGGYITPNGWGGGNRYSITVNAGMGTNAGDVERAVVSAIKRYEKDNGTRWRR